jgi:hypothetical protein
MKTRTQFTQEQIDEVMQKRGSTRTSALKWLSRNVGDKKEAATTPDNITRARHDSTPKRDSVRVPGVGDIPLVEAPKRETHNPSPTKEKPKPTKPEPKKAHS